MAESEGNDDEGSAALTCAGVYLLQADGTCYSCKQSTPMFGVMGLPPFALEGGEYPIDEDECMFREIVEMPAQLAEAIRASAGPCFRPDFSRTAGALYWMNHCKHCDAKQGDFFVHGPDGPFWPYDEAQMDAIQATRLDGPFRFVDPSTAYSGAMVEWRDRKHGVQGPPPKAAVPRKKRKPKAGA